MLRRILKWFVESHRPLHLLGGLAIGLCAGSPEAALYCATIAGACLELKDRQWGGRWDNVDLVATVVGGAIAALIHALLR